MLRRRLLQLAAVALIPLAGAPITTLAAGTDLAVSKPFSGPAVESGSVTVSRDGKQFRLTLSDDFNIHKEPPDPHWRVIDAQGNVYLLNKLNVKDDKVNKSIVLPGYIHNVARVQMWCSFVESVLGEAPFAKPVALR